MRDLRNKCLLLFFFRTRNEIPFSGNDKYTTLKYAGEFLYRLCVCLPNKLFYNTGLMVY